MESVKLSGDQMFLFFFHFQSVYPTSGSHNDINHYHHAEQGFLFNRKYKEWRLKFGQKYRSEAELEWHGGVWKGSICASKVNLCKIILSLTIYSDFIICVNLLQAVPQFDTACPAAANVASYGFIYRRWGVKWRFGRGQMMFPVFTRW